MKFEWEDIFGYTGLYSVSANGLVWSYPKTGKGGHNGKYLKPAISRNGYLYITLVKNNKKLKRSVHNLVATTFIENKKNSPQINHKDGNKKNNTVTNLEWCTNSENTLHSYQFLNRKKTKAWLGKTGDNHNKSKEFYLKDISGRIIRYESGWEFERKTGFSKESINYARKNKPTGCVFTKGEMKGLRVYFKYSHAWSIDENEGIRRGEKVNTLGEDESPSERPIVQD